MNKEIIYTESATKKIEIVVEDFKKRIEIDIVNSKYYFGEDNIEITASDIEDSYKRVQIVKNTKKTTEVRKKIFLAYFILGVFTLFFGLFYDQMQYLVETNPLRLILVLIGFVSGLVSGVSYFLLQQREKENERKNKKINNIYNIKNLNTVINDDDDGMF